MRIRFRQCLFIFLVFFMLITLTGCFHFNEANLDFLYDVELSEMNVDLLHAYYLSENGTLYCAGADPDGGSYVFYQDESKGIVAENVVSFSPMSAGGYYIDRDQNLYIWNKEDLPIYGYKRKNHTLILKNVLSASFDAQSMMYIDVNRDLYYVGDWNGEPYTLEQPMKIGANAEKIIKVSNEFIVWLDTDGKIHFFGTTTDENLLYIKDYFQDAKIQDITWANKDSILVLTDGKLWFYGNYQYLTEGVGDSKTSKELKLLCENVCSVSSNAWNALGALDSENQFFVWGRCLINDAEHAEEPEYGYVEKRLISDCAKFIHLSGSTISYIDVNGASHIYHSDGWIDFYGNSTNDKYVGINRNPVTWIKPEK